MEVGGRGLRGGHETPVAVDRRERQPGEGLLAVFEVAADAEEVDDGEDDDEEKESPDPEEEQARDTTGLPSRAVARIRCGSRLGRARREWQWRP